MKPCASPARMQTSCAAGSLVWSIFLTCTVSTYVLCETFLNPGQAFRLANYVCHCTDRQTAGAVQPYWFAVV